MKSVITNVAAAAVLATAATGAQAAVGDLQNGDVLNITSGVQLYDATGNPSGVASGSWFAMDTDANSKIAAAEKTAITAGTVGLKIGVTTTPGQISSWSFYGATGMDWLATPATGGVTSGVNLSGWTVNWNGGDIPMNGGAWTPLNAGAAGMQTSTYVNGIGKLVWDGTNGGAYTLDYTATVPTGSFAGVKYALHLTGTVAAVPEASTYGMMLAGLGLVGFAVRRRKIVA